jgi:hypothetical protein
VISPEILEGIFPPYLYEEEQDMMALLQQELKSLENPSLK